MTLEDVAWINRARLQYSPEAAAIQSAMVSAANCPDFHREFARSKLAAYAGDWATFDGVTDQLATSYKNTAIPGDEERTQVEIIMLIGQRFGTFNEMQKHNGQRNCDIAFVVDNIQRPSDECVLECVPNIGWYQIKASREFFSNNHAEFYLRRLLYMRPLFELLCQRASAAVLRLRVTLSDFGRSGALSFSGTDSSFILAPDPVFTQSKAYERHRASFASNEIKWEEKLPIVFWRGSTTGMVSDLTKLPRFMLCVYAETSSFRDMMDIRINGLVQRGEDDYAEIRRRGFEGEYVPDVFLNKYKYHIDIDGNTNSWPGLFIKLLSGGLIFKISSASGFRQWYYDRLRPWEHYVPVLSDLSDLDKQIEWAITHDDEAKGIANNASTLAGSMTLGGELKTACAQCYERCA